MSESCSGTRDWRLYVRDMIRFAERALSYVADMDQSGFLSDALTYDAVLRNIELIGEAATHIPNDVRDSQPEIEWRSIVGARNQVAHGYLGIDDDVVWDIIKNDLPTLTGQLRELLDSAG
ncbi:MAG: DUF86 domain-containing protein [Chloroflexi bacterium]|nr:DUF86 domain-containing protein [Chloroflexota bacterium]